MMHYRKFFSLAIIIMFLGITMSARAAERSFVVLPFTVNGPQNFQYLSKSIPGTILNRLNRPGIIQGKSGSAQVASDAAAQKEMKSMGTDYAVWGIINIVGNNCTVETHSIDKKGKKWSKSASGSVADLTRTVQSITASLGNEALGAPVATNPANAAGVKRVNQMNPDIMLNETGQQQAYLNPQFRYQGAGTADGSRVRTQRLPFNMVDMAVGDFNGDGRNEVAILGDFTVYIYSWDQDGKLRELGQKKISSSNDFSMRAMDLNGDGAKDLIIATFEDDSNRPYSYFLSFKGNSFKEIAPRAPYFASVIRMPPNFRPVLVGQNYDTVKLFAPGVREMVRSGEKYTLGGKIDLPSGANVFNVAWIPGGRGKSNMLVMIGEDERIKLFQGNNEKPLHKTMERFSGSATGMEHYKTVAGLGIDRNGQLPGKYYAPMRMIAADLGNTGENVLLLNKPISTAAQFFDRYRFFPQGEIHALFWDGVGLALKWKTRRIRGSVAEIDLADVQNDGILDLVVGVNTSPDLGIGSRQCMVVAYPLDVTKMDPKTPVDMSDFEVNPGNGR